MLTQEEIKEIRATPEFKEAFATALGIHQKEHEPGAKHFRDCVECKSGFALLLIGGLEALQKEQKK